VLGSMGVDAGAGTLDVSSDGPLFVFARVWAQADGGGSFGYGTAGQTNAALIAPGSRGVFIAATDNAPDGFSSDLTLVNSDAGNPATVAVNAAGADGKPAGSQTVTLGPGEVRVLAGAFSVVAGSSADIGRLDVVPADGSPGIFATLLRRDARTGDTDALLPFVIAK